MTSSSALADRLRRTVFVQEGMNDKQMNTFERHIENIHIYIYIYNDIIDILYIYRYTTYVYVFFNDIRHIIQDHTSRSFSLASASTVEALGPGRNAPRQRDG